MPRVTTPLAYNGLVYMVRNGGILGALDLATGRERKTGRLSGAIDEYFASPVAAGGKILTTSRSCKLTWVQAGANWEALKVNDLGEECFATPALGHDGIFVRTHKHHLPLRNRRSAATKLTFQSARHLLLLRRHDRG